MSKPKFKVGDTVRILDGSKIKGYTGGWTDNMKRFIGEIVTIKSIFSRSSMSNSYYLKEHPYTWDERGLELVKPEKIIIYHNGAEVVAKNTSTGKTGVAKCNPADEFDFETGAEIAFNRLLGDSVHHNFKVGDRVIGTKAADNMYGITNAGWKGVVTKKCSRGDIVVEGVDDDSCKVQFCVCPNYFKLDKTETPKPNYYTGKVVCIDDRGCGHTKGKVYRVKNGSIEFDSGRFSSSLFSSIDDINSFYTSQFIELVE